MTPTLALFITLCFVASLLTTDLKLRSRTGSVALLIPAAWIAIAGSRPVSYWFVGAETEMSLEGNPINTLTLALLIVGALIVLQKKRIHWGAIFRKNKPLFFIYLFFALSSLWSEEPFTSFKRVIKDFGGVAVALVFLMETDPEAAIRAVFVRVSYFLFPLSVLCWKYFPDIGRNYSLEGVPMFTGLSTQKNSLGQVTMVFGLIILYDFFKLRKSSDSRNAGKLKALDGLMLVIGVGTLLACNSKTALACLLLGVAALIGGTKVVNRANGKQILATWLGVVLCLLVFDRTFGVSELAIKTLGRDSTLTGRTKIWDAVQEQHTDPILGEGFNIFWNSQKGKAVIDSMGAIQSTHNGYLEMYVDGGLAGFALLLLFLFACWKKVFHRLFARLPLGVLGLAFWLIAILYNFSESSFFRLDLLWFTFLLMVLECPSRSRWISAPTFERAFDNEFQS